MSDEWKVIESIWSGSSTLKVIKVFKKTLKTLQLTINIQIYKKHIEVEVHMDGLSIATFVNGKNELEFLIQIAVLNHYLQSSHFKQEILNITNYREKRIELDKLFMGNIEKYQANVKEYKHFSPVLIYKPERIAEFLYLYI